ncbi:hypothetical protein HG535_0A06320 [Zygotorulaspora mrakii]|uniref:J domain-containing protein n=1 Tax=Zygotorulaspora mrakii TaxID=42260 RepID=A0A7H9AWB8_ZYGMR|nr:uncharacterized protein HG535_0A06320 [Zygotorulaspora mrakii]QLG70690.1 hypothetical protein HG535_0A06320 [Zygotorulaspora mrakii]
MPQSYEYDESSETWPFFVLTLLLMVLIPLTILQVHKLLLGKSGGVDDTDDPDQNLIQKQLENVNDALVSRDVLRFRQVFDRKGKRGILNVKNVVIVVGWFLVASIVQRVMNNDAIVEAATGLFDPYSILSVSINANDREIKSAYRKLSVKFHPDKLSKDLSPEERTVMEEAYVQITKAYEALTDELTKENFLRYGHPDGPQNTTHGIALPRFLVDGVGSPLVVLFYVALLGVILPYFVSKWWSKTQLHTKKGIHVKTASYFVDRLINYKPSEVVTVDLIINWLSHAEEFKIFYPEFKQSDFEGLLHDHLNRREEPDKARRYARYRIVAKCHSLLHGLLDISCGFRNTDIANMTLETFKCIVQAVPHSPYRQIFQLPHVDRKKFSEGSIDEVCTLGKLFTYEDAKISKILGISDEKNLKETLTVASNIPNLKLLKAEFLVPGEPQVTLASTPHLSIKLLIRSAKHKAIPAENFPQEMMEEPQDFEFQKDPFAVMLKEPLLPYSYAPFFPTKRRDGICCLVGLQKDGKLLQTPVTIQRLSLKNLTKDFDKRQIKELNNDNFKPEDWEIGTIKIPLGQPAPNETGDVFFRVIVKSTDYFTSDLDFTVAMQVRDSQEQYKQATEDEYETDEESDKESDEDDEDDEDEVSDSDYTDIDTDTEVEEDAVDEKK